MLDPAKCGYEIFIELQQHPTALHSCGRPTTPTNDNKEHEDISLPVKRSSMNTFTNTLCSFCHKLEERAADFDEVYVIFY